jgi:hypothetical protein
VGRGCGGRGANLDRPRRTFNNDLDHEQCCYFFGVRRAMSVELEDVLGAIARVRRGPRALPSPDGEAAGDPSPRARRRPGSARPRVSARAR